jgi:NAD+ kinase
MMDDMARKRIVLVGNMAKPGVDEQIARLRGWFAERVEVAAELASDHLDPSAVAGVDLIVVFGGDGTLLSTARQLASCGAAMLGVNMGKLGFLAEFDVEHMQKHFDEVLAGQVETQDRMMLSVHLDGCEESGGSFDSLAANDVAVSAGEPFRMIDLRVQRGENLIAQYLGDGLVVSTPTGSTGYNMSVGGPILHPSLEAVSITPIAPHTFSLRPVCCLPTPPLEITAWRVNPGTRIIIDGQVLHQLCDGQVVRIQPADHPLRLIRHPGRSYFQTLADKLQWGHSPHHGRA